MTGGFYEYENGAKNGVVKPGRMRGVETRLARQRE